MQREQRTSAFRVLPFVAFGFALLFPILFRAGFGGSISILLLVAAIGIKILIYWQIETAGGPVARTIWQMVSGITTLVYAALVLISILITPYSSYRFWLENVQFGEAEGTVSNLMVVLVAFVATVLSPLVIKRRYGWALMTMTVVVAALLAFSFQTSGWLLAVIAALGLFFLFMAYRNGYPGSRVRGFVQLGGLFAVCLIVAGIITGSADPTGSRLVDVQLYPALRQAVLSLFPRFPLLYAIPGYGYSFNETKKLGGTPVLSTAAIFEVTVPERSRLYLRTRSYDLYDGSTWQLSTDADDSRRDSILVQSRRSSQNEIGVKLLSEYYSLVPHTLDTVRVRFAANAPAVQRGNRDIGFLLAKPIKRNTEFHIQRGAPPNVGPPQDMGPFLEIPDDTPETVRYLAEQLALDASGPEEILKRIEQYLALNYTYSLEVEEEGQYSEDFVTDFLFGELQGYCVHFATSFALLARLNGVPTRYATGFLVSPGEGEGPIEVTGLHAHAWPEVWLQGAGWTIWEATPALNPLNWEFLEDEWLYNLGLGSGNLTNQQLAQVLGPRASRLPEVQEQPFTFPFVWVGSGLAMMGLGVLAWFAVNRAVVLMRGDRHTFVYRLKGMVRASSRRGIDQPEKTGWVQWVQSVEDRFQLGREAAERAVGLITETVYGGKQPTRKDIRYLRMIFERLRHRGRGGGREAA
jgi:transglutaminase-like putative cysteine protease